MVIDFTGDWSREKMKVTPWQMGKSGRRVCLGATVDVFLAEFEI